MNRVDRLFGLLVLLQSKRYTSADEIAERFSMSVRTVYRDIKALNEQGVPVLFEPHRGYYIMHGFFLPPVSFTSEEAQALLLSEQLVEGFADRSIRTHVGTALTKIRAVLRSAQKDEADVLSDRLRIQLPARLRDDAFHLAPLQQAIAQRTQVHLTYRSAQGEETERVIEPLGLIFYAFSWHVVAWCSLRKTYRDFKVQRIVDLRPTADPFTQEHTLSIHDFMASLPVPY